VAVCAKCLNLTQEWEARLQFWMDALGHLNAATAHDTPECLNLFMAAEKKWLESQRVCLKLERHQRAAHR
jgi:hypothetical protein